MDWPSNKIAENVKLARSPLWKWYSQKLLRSSYTLQYRPIASDSTMIITQTDETPTQRFSGGTPVQQFGNSWGIANGQRPADVQQMEEQTVYWSADENPFYYHTSKRFYGQPYQVDSGFYGYTLSKSPTSQQRTFQSSSSQTQIAHIFSDQYQPFRSV
ncbi:hypothetical protein KIN20_006924 [Parelaphostrongylus tenuis]|uniref:Uncharacterized protein n=1 Tax=Parelaphostrongylus tenuis TaxID=148309 RepID=A0AAD5ML61_PARTN|nr:hypothetical protein KIN20_006924 [Parelaphostrongylus tenuis]